jgi:hypothetical protein
MQSEKEDGRISLIPEGVKVECSHNVFLVPSNGEVGEMGIFYVRKNISYLYKSGCLL